MAVPTPCQASRACVCAGFLSETVTFHKDKGAGAIVQDLGLDHTNWTLKEVIREATVAMNSRLVCSAGCTAGQAGEGEFHVVAHDGKFLHDDGSKLKLHGSGDSKWRISPA